MSIMLGFFCRRALLLVQGLGLILTCTLLVGCGEEPPYTIGLFGLNSKLQPAVESFKHGMREQGYIEEKDVTYLDYSGLLNRAEAEKALESLAKADIDLLYTLTTPATQMAKKKLGGKVPIVFGPVYYPKKSGIVDNLAQPGGSITGVRVGGGGAKALEILLKISPKVKTVFVPFRPKEPASEQSLEDLQEAAKIFDIEVLIAEVNSQDEVIEVLGAIPEEADAIWLLNSTLLTPLVKKYVETAVRQKVPLVSSTGQHEEGVMLTYGPHAKVIGLKASHFVHRIIEGIPPGDLPVEDVGYYFGVNLKTAALAGIEIPGSVLVQADEIVYK